MAAGVPQEKTAWGLNQLCGSGLRAVALGLQQIANGDAKIIVAGGQESMSQAQHAAHLRSGTKMGDLKFVDTMLKDGLMDAFHGYHMGTTAENIASKWQLSREDQDKFAVRVAEQGRGRAEGRPLQGRDRARHGQGPQGRHRGRPGRIYSGRHDARGLGQAEARLLQGRDRSRPAMRPGINDGAAAVVLMTAEEAKRRGLTPLARIASWATAGVDPAVMGSGPIPASRKALEKAGWKVKDLDLVEANEAFAAQALAVNKDMGWDPGHRERQRRRDRARPPDRRLRAPACLTTLLYEMQRRDAKKGLATLCIGGGMGIAMTVER